MNESKTSSCLLCCFRVVTPASAEGWKSLKIEDLMIYVVVAAAAGRSNTLFGLEERRESCILSGAKFEGRGGQCALHCAEEVA